MLDKIAFRHILATVQVLLFLILAYRCVSFYWAPPQTSGNVSWDWRSMDPPPVPIECDGCVAINLPAVLALGWIATFLPDRWNWVAFVIMSPGVWILWYCVGVWWERRSGSLAKADPARGTWITWIGAWLGLAVIASAVVFVLVTGIDDVLQVAFLVWSVAGIFFISSKMRSWRKLRKNAA